MGHLGGRWGSRERTRLDDLLEQYEGLTTVRLGVDVGKLGDPTALVTTEEETRDGAAHYLVHHIERLPLGTSYVGVADRIEAAVTNLRARSDRQRDAGGRGFGLQVIVDGTGVGMPVVDLIRERGVKPSVAIFTGTEKLTVHPDDALSIGKAWLVARLQTLLQAERLHWSTTPEAAALAAELRDYQVEVSESGHAAYNARSGGHDDLVIALGLSVGTGQRNRGATPWVRPRGAKGRW